MCNTESICRRLMQPIAVACMVFLPGTLVAEAPVPRVPPFHQGVELPSCPTVWHNIGDFVVDTGEFIGSRVSDIGQGWADLVVHGDPAAMLRSLDNTWNDLKSTGQFAAQASYYVSPMVVTVLLEETLPGGAFQSAMADIRRTTQSVASDVVDASLDAGAAAIMEVGQDGWRLLSTIDNPAKFAETFGRLNQKWNPAVTWSYMLEAGDPLQGMMTTVQAYKAQFDKLSNLSGANALATSSVKAGLMQVAMNRAETDILPLLGSNTEREAFRAMALAVRTEVLTDREVDPGLHPLYRQARIRQIAYEPVYEDRGSGAAQDLSLWRPRLADIIGGRNADCISLGDWAVYEHPESIVPPGRTLMRPALCNAMQGLGTWWKRPVDYEMVWSDRCSGAQGNGSIWQPVCPDGYTAMGFVAGNWAEEKPLPNRIACLKNDPAAFRMESATTALSPAAAPRFFARPDRFPITDRGSGAKFDVSIFMREFAGVEVMYALRGYQDDGHFDLRNLQVPVAWGVPGNVPSIEEKLRRQEAQYVAAAKQNRARYQEMPDIQMRAAAGCLDQAASRARDNALSTASCRGDATGQQFTLRANQHEGWFQAISGSGHCLTPSNHAQTAGTGVLLYPCERNDSTYWRPLHLGNNRIVLQHLGGQCLTQVGSGFNLHACAPSVLAGQQLTVLNGAVTYGGQAAREFPAATHAGVQLWNPARNQCVAGDTVTAPATLQRCDTALQPGQLLRFEPQANRPGDYVVKTERGQCLTPDGFSGSAGARMLFWNCDATKAVQHWRVRRLDNTHVTIENASSKMCLVATPGALTQQACSAADPNQRFRFGQGTPPAL